MLNARYCLQLERQSEAINIDHVVTNINEEYRLVLPNSFAALINDISYAYDYFKNQQVEEVSRAGYWKFRVL